MNWTGLRVGLFLYLSCIHFTGFNAARVLGIFWYPSKSHQNIFQIIWNELSLRGHQVTLITPYPTREENFTNLTVIDASSMLKNYRRQEFVTNLSTVSWSWSSVINVKYMVEELLETMLQSDEVNDLLKSDKEFDVVIIEAHSPLLFAFGERYKAPVVGKFQ